MTKEELNLRIGIVLKALRVKKDVSQDKLAVICDKNKQQISMWENGSTALNTL
jgi:transcriptional regulator with XRE-family HTH domain